MKTKEEILEETIDSNNIEYWRDVCYRAMQLYSDQQNKEKDAEIQRLTKEVEDLREKLYQLTK